MNMIIVLALMIIGFFVIAGYELANWFVSQNITKELPAPKTFDYRPGDRISWRMDRNDKNSHIQSGIYMKVDTSPTMIWVVADGNNEDDETLIFLRQVVDRPKKADCRHEDEL